MAVFHASDALRISMRTTGGGVDSSTVYVATKVWFQILEDLGVGHVSLTVLLQALKEYGLPAIASAGEDIAEDILNLIDEGCTTTFDVLTRLGEKYDTYRGIGRIFLYVLTDIEAHGEIHHTLDASILRSWLQGILFLERFTFSDQHVTSKTTIDKFLAANEGCKRFRTYCTCIPCRFQNLPGEDADGVRHPSYWPPRYLYEAFQYALSRHYNPKFWKYSTEDAGFSDGACRDAKSPAGKWFALSKIEPCFMRDIRYPFPGGQSGLRGVNSHPLGTVVPKKMTSGRMIAIEDTPSIYYGHACLKALRRMLKGTHNMEYINERNQDINRGLALDGSYPEGMWATFDLSSASDSISRYIFLDAIPKAFVPMYRNCMSEYIELPWTDGAKHSTPRLRKLHMLLTSGHPLTWLTEAVYFRCLAIAALMVMCGLTYDKARKLVYAYGDDLIIPVEYAPEVAAALELFGHVVNQRKSFYNGLFRESCGGWYFHGQDVTPVFWPRKVITPAKSWSPSRISSVEIAATAADLQHKLYHLKSTRELLEGIAMSSALACGEAMTFSHVGSTLGDLWSPNVSEADSARLPHWGLCREISATKRTDLLDHVMYYQFLKDGPRYASPLDKLLGISEYQGAAFRYETGSVRACIQDPSES